MKYEHVLITGATGGVGGALALELAAPKTLLSLTGRNQELLDQVVSRCSSRGGSCHASILDLRDTEAVNAWVLERDAHKPVDLVIANAGVSCSLQPDGSGESIDDVRRLFAVNTLGVVETVTTIAERMRQRGRGKIAIIGSLAGLQGLPSSPAYCASKAAAMVYGRSLRAWLAPYGVGVSVVALGFVDTCMSRRYIGGKPMMCLPEKAARTICKGLEANKSLIAVPLPVYLGQKLLSFLPRDMGDALHRRFFSFVVEPDSESSMAGDRCQ